MNMQSARDICRKLRVEGLDFIDQATEAEASLLGQFEAAVESYKAAVVEDVSLRILQYA